MNSLEFIAEMVKALAWPAAVFTLLLLFRRQFLALVPEISSLRYRNFEVEFRQSLKQAQSALKDEPPSAFPPHPEGEFRLSRLSELASIAPRAAILEAWLEVETSAAAALERQQQYVPKGTRVSPSPLGQEVRRAEILSSRWLEVFDRLRHIRNRAVHVPDVVFDPDEVIEYLNLASSLAAHLRSR